MSLVVKHEVRKLCTGHMMCAGFTQELDKQLKQIIMKACERAKENGRRTVMGKRLMKHVIAPKCL